MAILLFQSKLSSLPTCIDGPMFIAVTAPISVWGSRAMSLSDKFLSTTATP